MINKTFNYLEKAQTGVIAIVAILLILVFSLLFRTSSQDSYVVVQDEIISISKSIRSKYGTKPDYWGLDNKQALTFLPKEHIRNGKIISSIGREYTIGQNQNGDVVMPSQRMFMITLNNLSKKVCESIASLEITNNNLGLQKVLIKNSTNDVTFEWGGEHTLPISYEDASNYCKNKNSLSWVFE